MYLILTSVVVASNFAQERSEINELGRFLDFLTQVESAAGKTETNQLITKSNNALGYRFNIVSEDLKEGIQSISDKLQSLVVKKFHEDVFNSNPVDALLVTSVNACATEFKHALLTSLVDFDSLSIKIAKKINASFQNSYKAVFTELIDQKKTELSQLSSLLNCSLDTNALSEINAVVENHRETIRDLIPCTQFDIVDWFLSQAKKHVDDKYEAIKSIVSNGISESLGVLQRDLNLILSKLNN
jgi:hypothetical protein